MKRAWRLCLILSAVCLLAGCTGKRKNPSQEVMSPDVQGEAVVPERTHSIVADEIDYLSVQGIFLEPSVGIVMVATDSENEFYKMVEAGALQAVEDMNELLGYTGKDQVQLTFVAPKNDDVIEQINIIDQFLDQAPEALCIAFSDETACKTQMDMARDNDIKLIAFDTAHEDNTTEASVTTDNVAAASIAASALFNQMEDGAKVAIIAHNSTKQTGLERYRAITNVYKEEYAQKGLHFVDVVYLAQDERTAEEVFEELLQKHPDLAGVICTDLITTEGAIEFAEKCKDEKFQIVGFDISERIVEAVEEGAILGTVAQDPYGMGYATVVAAARAIAGMTNAQNIQTTHLWIDQSNLDSPQAAELFVW